MTRVIFFEFAGRQGNMQAQRPHITRLLDANPGSYFHLWDLTRQASDQAYLVQWANDDERVRVMGQFHTGHPIRCIKPPGPRRRGHPRCVCMKCKPPYEQPYKWYANALPRLGAEDTVFVKFDDDVIWMDTDAFPEVLEFLETRPNAVASANVVNNAVCAKYDPALYDLVRTKFGIGGRLPAYDRDWWALHTSADFAWLSHNWMRDRLNYANLYQGEHQPPVRTRPGERVSINFIAMKYPVLRKMAGMMRDGRLGDEGTVDTLLPWIIPNFRVAHLTFGPQEKTMTEAELDRIRKAYQ